MLYFMKKSIDQSASHFQHNFHKKITRSWTQLTLEMLPLISLRFGKDPITQATIKTQNYYLAVTNQDTNAICRDELLLEYFLIHLLLLCLDRQVNYCKTP